MCLDMSYIANAKYNAKYKKHVQGPLEAAEINGAEKFVVKVIQSERFSDNKVLSSLNVFEEKDGLLRVRTQVFNRQDIRVPLWTPHDRSY